MTEENVKVAVRVRPFNSREKARSAQLILDMDGNTTYIRDPSGAGEVKAFTFDHSYWSFDGYKDDGGYLRADPTHRNARKFSDQEVVCNDLGQDILKNAWGGYNATLFAYGQTGAGKSYSVLGYGPNKGIVPKLCERIFDGIREQQQKSMPVQYEVKYSMLEVYNEVVYDLLADQPVGKKQQRVGLKIRQHPKKGFFAEDLKHVLVTSYGDIESLMEQGTVNRTVAFTNTNATSSRAHTLVGIHFTQKQRNAAGQETAKTSVINLVDLAGSERAGNSGGKGERLKEGAAINRSLSCLSQCIFALSEVASGQKTRIPFRDSALTRLLQNALLGNSKTVMVAALSPADIHYEQTLSTLRYADRAKQIKTKAVVNEDPTEKLLRELKEENERLRAVVASGNIDVGDTRGMSETEVELMKGEIQEELKAQMLENEREAQDMKKTYGEKLRSAQLNAVSRRPVSASKERERKPHIFNLNSDPQLTGRIAHILKRGTTVLGNQHSKASDVTIIGPGIQEHHAILTLDEKTGRVNVTPSSTECRMLVNGAPIQGQTTLCHNDRLLFGGTQMWVFADPVEAKKDGKKYPTIDYEYAQAEIAAKNGISMRSSVDADQAALQQDQLELLPGVTEANSISEEMDWRVKFELMLVSPYMTGRTEGRTEVCVKNRNLRNNAEYVWSKEKFRNRLYLMQEMYTKFAEDEDWKVPLEEEHPFLEPPDTEVMIGTCQLVLQPLAFNVELKEQMELINYRGQPTGVINMDVAPCDRDGNEYTEKDDRFVDGPEMLIGQEVCFAVKISSVRGLPNKYTDVYCRYQLYLEEEHCTEKIDNTTNPLFDDKRVFRFKPATRQLMDYLNNRTVSVQVWGRYNLRELSGSLKDRSTKEIMKMDRGIFNRTANLMGGFQMNGSRQVDPQKQSIAVELLLMKKTQDRLKCGLEGLMKMLHQADKLGHPTLSTTLALKMLDARTSSQVDEYIQQIRDDRDYDSHSGERYGTNSFACILT